MSRAILQYSHCISDTTLRRWAGRAGRGARGAAGARGAVSVRGAEADARGAQPRRAAGLWAVHLVHSACF